MLYFINRSLLRGSLFNHIVLFFLLLQTTASHAQVFDSVTPLTPFLVSKNSGDKPQSKVWKYDNKWWSVFPNSSGTFLWKLEGNAWKNVLKIAGTSIVKADCKAVSDVCHILLWRTEEYSSLLVSLQYDPPSQNYKLWSKRPSTTNIYLDPGVEIGTIDVDANGRMWLASDGINDIRVRWSDSPYTAWSNPIIIASNVSDDDIGAVIALPQGQVGIFWSNQVTKRWGFKTHTNGASPSAWSADELPASQSALNVGSGMADDHLNLTVASDGSLYCAVKTGYDSPGHPQVALLKRQPDGSWDDLYPVADIGTKPIVVINQAADLLKVIFCKYSGSDIVYKESPLSGISFGPTTILIKGIHDNATSAKDNYNADVVILASDNINKQIVGVLASDIPPSTPPDKPQLLTPTNLSTGQPLNPTLGWGSAANATAYRIQVSDQSDFSNLVFVKSDIQTTSVQPDGLAYVTKYYWRVQAFNAAGNSAWSGAWSFTTQSAPVVSGLAGFWKLDEGSGTTIKDDSGNGNNGECVGSPSWSAGVAGSALKLNGVDQYARVPDAPSLDITEEITLAAWIQPGKISSQKIILKGDSKIADGYELSLLSTGKVSFKINPYTSDVYKINSSALYPIDGTWMHIAGTFNGTVMKIFINGTENKSITFGIPASIVMNALPFAIGGNADGTSKFQGAIDEVRIYDYSLTAIEIYDLANVSSAKSNGTARQQTKSIAVNDEEAIDYGMHVFPNPAGNSLTVKLNPSTKNIISISGMNGRILYRTVATGNNTLSIDLDAFNLKRGLYLLLIQSSDSITATKFLKK